MKAIGDGTTEAAAVEHTFGGLPTFPSGLFRVAHSVFSSEALKGQLAQAYPIAAPVSCHLLETGPNDTYLVTTREQRYIARVYGARWRSLSDICYELELLTYLDAKGVSVSVPIATHDGKLSYPVAAPEGTRHLALFTYAEGAAFSWKEDDCYRAGRLLATIHAVSRDFVSQHVRFRLDLESLIDTPLSVLRSFLAHRPEDWLYLQGFAARLRARAEAATNTRLDWGVCHGDFGGNIHVSGNRRLTVFDFDLCSPGWRAFDLVVFRWGAMSRKRETIWHAFLHGYSEKKCLAEADLAAVPLFCVIRHLWTMGMRANQVEQLGILPVSDSYLDYRLGSFRRWEAEQ
jgi:Ser/Thr protein kinase RdoA (MazF antagonist)